MRGYKRYFAMLWCIGNINTGKKVFFYTERSKRELKLDLSGYINVKKLKIKRRKGGFLVKLKNKYKCS